MDTSGAHLEEAGLFEGVGVVVPRGDSVLDAYLAQTFRYVEQAISPQAAHLQAQIRSSGSVSTMNKLGMVYAHYDPSDLAEGQFRQALDKQAGYLPAILNLGHFYYLKQDWADALKCYRRPNELAPDNPHVVLALAPVNQELENYREARLGHERL